MSKDITRDEFEKKYVGSNLVVNCKTFELSQEFRELADKFGYKWCTGASYVDVSEWLDYKERTCYELHQGMYASTDSYREHGYKVVEFNGFKDIKHERHFKTTIKLNDENFEHCLIVSEDKMKVSFNILLEQCVDNVPFQAIDDSMLYIRKKDIKYIKTEVL